MPYATPVDHQDPDIPPQIKLCQHQRSCSAKATFVDERGPRAFAPMPKLPRHKSQPPCTIFHFSQDDSNSSDELGSSSNMLGLTVDTRNVLSDFPTVDAAIPLSRVAGHLATPAAFPDAVDPYHPLQL